MATGDEEAGQAERLAAELGVAVGLHRRGGESRTYLLAGTDHLVTVPLGWPADAEPADRLARRVSLLARVGPRVSLPVPEVVRTLPEAGLVVVRRVPGAPLLDLPTARRDALAPRVADALGGLLAELHTWPRAECDDLADVDDYAPADWQRETAALAGDLAARLDAEQRRDLDRFLDSPVPAPAAGLVLTHHDLGIEHVLVDDAPGGSGGITGVIDWDDAAIGDPAHDFGLILRDLGPAALDRALAAYARQGGRPSGLGERARYLAACTLLEDLAFGYAEARPEYVAKSLAAWDRTFRALA